MKPQAFTRFTTLRDRLTVGQRAFALVAYDGLEPSELIGTERERAREIFGAVDTIPAAARRVVVMNKGREVGGTRMASERAAHLSLTLTLSRTDDSETVFVFYGGPKARHGRVGLRFARAALRAHGVKFLDDSKDGFTIQRHDGRAVRHETFAASRGGDNIRGVPIIAAVLTEAAFYYDEASGTSNGEQIFAAIVPRLLPGGQIIIESTPWAEGTGLHWREFSRNHGQPATALAALCPTLVMRDDAETIAMVAAEYERDPDNAGRELGASFMPVGSGKYFDHFAVQGCADASMPLVLTADPGWDIVAGYDPAYIRDAAEGVIVRVKDGRCEVADVFTRIPERGKPLVPSEVDTAFAELVEKHGGRVIATDIHYREAVREHVAERAISLAETPGGNTGKVQVYAAAREIIHAGRARWSEGHRRLTRQVGDIIAKPLPGGLLSISSPRRRGDHGDAASALCLALWCAASQARGFIDWDEVLRINGGSTRGFNEPPLPSDRETRWGGIGGRGFG
ncbi:MAG TPA: hypothetical protein VH062_13495 [Polyangiaceae bacterium]|nr:hypothetical protein [Polyangiaceae bacterium]